ncbi:TadE/TadG family type IV pilus assembly protein [Paenibacillus sp. CMAA1364]
MLGKWVRDQKGSVSIFLILILAVVFSFVAIFIDYARIAAMKVQSERLVRSAVRSVMSAYEPQLQQKYGLFAYGQSDGDQIMSEVLHGSMDHGDRGDAFSLLQLTLDSSTLQMGRTLGEYEVFHRQINEDMKYKAPIDFTLEMLNKFKPLSQSMKEASNTMDVLRKLQKLYDRREETLDEMITVQKTTAKRLESLPNLIMEPMANYISNQLLGGSISSSLDIAAQYDDYLAKEIELQQKITQREEKINNGKKEDEPNVDTNDLDQQIHSISNVIRGYHQGTTSILTSISNTQSLSRSEHGRMTPQALELWEQAYKLNEQMKQVIKESENRSADEGYDHVSHEDSPEGTYASSGDTDAIRKIREQTQKLLLSETLFQELKQGIEDQTTGFQTIDQIITSLNTALGGAFGQNGHSSQMKSVVIQTRQVIDPYMRKYVLAGSSNVLDTTVKRLEENRSLDKERKSIEKESKAKLKNATKMLSTINRLNDSAQEYMKEYRTVQQYFDESITFNKQSADGSYQGADLSSDPYDASKSAMDHVDGLYGSMSGMLLGLQDEFYQNEYASLYFQPFDITQLGDIIDHPDRSIGDELVKQLSIHNQELEYILYGFHNPVGNVSAAYAEIFGVRLAIRTMEGLVKSSKLGNPLLILATALLYGIEMATLDMIRLCQKGSIELSAYVKVEMTYRDYLRMFLFIHSNDENKMSRMLALIRFNTGINPSERATYASGEVVFGMKLWFLPGVMRMIGSTASDEDQVEGNRYYATKKADYSYE